jgi:hypothetical protein
MERPLRTWRHARSFLSGDLALKVLAIIAAMLCCTMLYGAEGALAHDGWRDRCAHDSVDMIEVNHYLNCSGEVQLDQIIFWDFSPGLGCYVVRDWRTCKHYSQVPYRTPDGRFQACWRDSRDQNAMRIVSAGHVMETWTDFDPETANQEKVERNLRVGLSPVKPRKRVKP